MLKITILMIKDRNERMEDIGKYISSQSYDVVLLQVYNLFRGVFRYIVYAGAYSGILSMQGRIQVYGLFRGVFRYMV